MQNDGPATLRALLVAADATGKKKLLQQLSMNLVPIMEKGLLDPLIVHGCVPLLTLLVSRRTSVDRAQIP